MPETPVPPAVMDAARRDVADARRRLSAGVRNGDATIAWQAALAALHAKSDNPASGNGIDGRGITPLVAFNYSLQIVDAAIAAQCA